jgi:hypothetical protein
MASPGEGAGARVVEFRPWRILVPTASRNTAEKTQIKNLSASSTGLRDTSPGKKEFSALTHGQRPLEPSCKCWRISGAGSFVVDCTTIKIATVTKNMVFPLPLVRVAGAPKRLFAIVQNISF